MSLWRDGIRSIACKDDFNQVPIDLGCIPLNAGIILSLLFIKC